MIITCNPGEKKIARSKLIIVYHGLKCILIITQWILI